MNAPCSKKLDAQTLALLSDASGSRQSLAGANVSVFGEVAPELQKAFAGGFHISEAELTIAAKKFAEFSGDHQGAVQADRG